MGVVYRVTNMAGGILAKLKARPKLFPQSIPKIADAFALRFRKILINQGMSIPKQNQLLYMIYRVRSITQASSTGFV